MLIDRTVVFIEFIKFGREVLDIAAANIKPGVTADEIDRLVHEVHSHFCMHISFFFYIMVTSCMIRPVLRGIAIHHHSTTSISQSPAARKSVLPFLWFDL